MPPTAWRGAISFGLVNVPIQLHTVVRNRDIRFRQIHAKTGSPVRQRRVDESTGEDVQTRDIVKGYEVSDGRFVVVEPKELDALAPVASRLIDIHDYVDQSEIDPVYYDRAYYLSPDGETARKPYRLLAEAMQRAGKVAIASFVMRNHAYLAAVRASDGLLLLSTMHYADEVADPSDIDVEAGDVRVDEREVEMAERLIDSLVRDFDPRAYRDEYRERLLEFLEAKAAGGGIEISEPSPSTDNVVDLLGALERSLERARGGSREEAGREERQVPGKDYHLLSRSELYELAKERDLPGRSRLNKDELIAALSEPAEHGVA